MIPTEDALRDAFAAGLDTGARVRVRRPGAVFQVELPAFTSDGDVAALYVRPGEPPAELVLTDLGVTRMRMSYHRSDPVEEEQQLTRLAEAQGLRFEGGELCTPVGWSDLLAAALGLLQVEAQAEALAKAARPVKRRRARFREAAHALVVSVFGEGVRRDFYDADRDPRGLYRLDALVPTSADVRRPLALSFMPGDTDAERAVSTKLFLQREGSVPSGTRWVAIPRDLERLRSSTRRRVVNEFEVPGASLEADERTMADRLRDLAA